MPISLFNLDGVPAGPENYLTHFFFGVLEQLAKSDPSVWNEFLSRAGLPPMPDLTDCQIDVSEQVHLGDPIFDARITVNGRLQVIVESKLGDDLNVNQLLKYDERAALDVKKYPQHYVLAITNRPNDLELFKQLNEQLKSNRIRHITWGELYYFIERLSVDPRLDVLRVTLMELMRERGVVPMTIKLHSHNKVAEAVKLAQDAERDAKTLLEKTQVFVIYPFDRIDNWFATVGQVRACFKVLDRANYPFDTHILLDVLKGLVEYKFHLAIRSWDRERSPNGNDLVYFEDSLDLLIREKDALLASASDCEVQIYDWYKDYYWNENVAQIGNWSRSALTTNWQRNLRSELVVVRKVLFDEIVAKAGLDASNREVELDPASVENLAKQLATSLEQFVNDLQPVIRQLK